MNNIILNLGIVFLLSFAIAKLTYNIKIPAITAYLILGIIIGPAGANLISHSILDISGFISNIVLGFVAFSLGRSFSRSSFSQVGKPILWISILAAVFTWILVTIGLILVKQPFSIAILLGAIASATAPTAVVVVIREIKSKGKFTNTLLGVVAIDDAWCLIIFSISLAVVQGLANTSIQSPIFPSLISAFIEIFGAFLLGGLMGGAIIFLSRFIKTSEDFLIFTIGSILTTSGIAQYFDLSLPLACMVLGTVLENFHPHSEQFFDSTISVESPLYLVFFVLAGAGLNFSTLRTLGLPGLIYIIARISGKWGGSYLGGILAKADSKTTKYIGPALLPQAGVAAGLALIAASKFPQGGDTILSLTIASIVIFELLGPPLTRFSLIKSGESQK